MPTSRKLFDIRYRPPFKGFLNCAMYANRPRTISNMRARGMAIPKALETLKFEDAIAECRDAGRKKCLRSQSVLRAVRPGLEVCGHSDDLEVGIVRSIYKGSIKDFEFNLLPNRIFGAEVERLIQLRATERPLESPALILREREAMRRDAIEVPHDDAEGDGDGDREITRCDVNCAG